MSKLRIGFLVDDENINFYIGDLINFIDKDEAFDQPIIITGYKKKTSSYLKNKLKILFENPLRFFDKVLKIIFLRFIRLIELPRTKKLFPNYEKKSSQLLENNYQRVEVSGIWSNSMISLSFNENEIKRISSLNLDCIIRCGTGILRGEILNITRYGILSFHHSDNRVIRGGPSGFWEVLKNFSSSGFIIQKLSEELDGGEVILRGNMMTREMWLLNNAQLLEKSNYFFKVVLKNLAKNQQLKKEKNISLHGDQLSSIKTSQPFRKYIIKILLPKIFNFLLEKILSPKVDRWSIAYAEHNNLSKSLWRYKEVKNPRGRFLADPFVFKKDGIDYIFVEDFFYSDRKGRISVIKISNGKYEFLGIVLEEEFHLSFPFIFESQESIFMIPETSQSKEIRLYKCKEFPFSWELECILMKNVNAADTMVINENDEWFLLTNICSANCDEHQSELHIFHSKDLKSNVWLPIETGNPVIFNSEQARNGGMFWHEKSLYRVNQKNKREHFGYAFEIRKIKKISKNEFLEELVCKVEPNFKSDIISTHHFNSNENIAVVDFCRKERLNYAKKN